MTDNELRDCVLRFLQCQGYERVEPLAALCDMDGVLYDSMPRHARAWAAVMRSLGVECREEEFFVHEGRTGAATIELLYQRAFGHGVTADEAARIYALKTELFKGYQQESPVPTIDGAQNLIAQMRRAGLRTILVTGSGQGSLLGRLESDYPEAFPMSQRVTSANVTHGKPHPEPYLRGLEFAGVHPWQAIALENAPLGVESAARSGVFTIAVATGPLPLQLLADAGAGIVFKSMDEADKTFARLLYTLRHTSAPVI